MAGILDKKSRVMDVQLTQYGRKEFAKNGFNVEYISFSDRNVDYQDLGESVLDIDNSSLISFETFSAASDILIPEYANAGDFTLTTGISPSLQVYNGQLIESEPQADGTMVVSDLQDFGFDTIEINGLESNWRNLGVLRDIHYNSDFKLDRLDSQLSYRIDLVSSNEGILQPISIDPRFGRSVTTRTLEPVYREGDNLVQLDTDEVSTMITDEEFSNEYKDNSQGDVTISFGDISDRFDILGQTLVVKGGKIRKLMVSEADETLNEDGTIKSKTFHLGEMYKTELNNTNVPFISRFGRSFTLVFHNGDIT